jgi:mercuric ion transport protein
VASSAIGAIGTALAALLGTACCIGPVTVAVLGAGGAIAAARLAPFRPYLLGAATLLLLFGFWASYRPLVVRGARSCSSATGRTTRIVLWLAAVVTAASAVLPGWLS